MSKENLTSDAAYTVPNYKKAKTGSRRPAKFYYEPYLVSCKREQKRVHSDIHYINEYSLFKNKTHSSTEVGPTIISTVIIVLINNTQLKTSNH